MFDLRSPRKLIAGAVAAAAAASVTVTGCGGSANQASSSMASGGAQAATAAPASQVSYTAAQLHNALLPRINGAKPAAAVESGPYGSLPEVKDTKTSMKGVSISPAKCAQATAAGFDSAEFAQAPASIATFRIGNNGLSEVLIAPSATEAVTALGKQLMAGCGSYRATVDGKTFTYTVRQSSLQGLGEQAKELNIKAAGYSQVDVWSVLYRGNGFVGAVTVVGPNASQAAVQVLAKDAYARAQTMLK
jgi:hypothetical protein